MTTINALVRTQRIVVNRATNAVSVENAGPIGPAGAASVPIIADGSITTAKLANLGVTTAKIADLSVSTGKLTNGAVTATKLGTNAVNNSHIADGSINPSKLESPAWSQLTATLTGATTNPNIGSTGYSVVRSQRYAKTVNWAVRILFNGSGVAAGSGFYYIAAPLTARVDTDGTNMLGSGYVYRSSTNSIYPVIVTTVGTNGGLMQMLENKPGAVSVISGTNPFTFAANDQIRIGGSYEAA